MAKKKTVTVMGLDIAAVNSGVCIITATPLNKPPHVEAEAAFEKGFIHGPKNNHEAKALFSDVIKGLCIQYGVDFCVIEDYAMNPGLTDTSGRQQGEAVGMIKKSLWEIKMPFMVVGPTSMRSFVDVPSRLKDKGKGVIIDFAKSEYGFSSTEGSQNRRSNATDAFIHSVIGATTFFHFKDEDLGDFNTQRSNVLFGDEKKMKGLVNSPQFFYGCEWAVFNEDL